MKVKVLVTIQFVICTVNLRSGTGFATPSLTFYNARTSGQLYQKDTCRHVSFNKVHIHGVKITATANVWDAVINRVPRRLCLSMGFWIDLAHDFQRPRIDAAVVLDQFPSTGAEQKPGRSIIL